MYKQPPLSSRFKKGQSGNPSGRPKRIDREIAILSSDILKLVSLSKSKNIKAKNQLKRIKEIINEKK